MFLSTGIIGGVRCWFLPAASAHAATVVAAILTSKTIGAGMFFPHIPAFGNIESAL